MDNNDAKYIFGYPDNLKLKSSMTLFSFADNNDIYEKNLDKFFDGEKDNKTIELL